MLGFKVTKDAFAYIIVTVVEGGNDLRCGRVVVLIGIQKSPISNKI